MQLLAAATLAVEETVRLTVAAIPSFQSSHARDSAVFVIVLEAAENLTALWLTGLPIGGTVNSWLKLS